jgi:hypothetical protein
LPLSGLAFLKCFETDFKSITALAIGPHCVCQQMMLTLNNAVELWTKSGLFVSHQSLEKSDLLRQGGDGFLVLGSHDEEFRGDSSKLRLIVVIVCFGLCVELSLHDHELVFELKLLR